MGGGSFQSTLNLDVSTDNGVTFTSLAADVTPTTEGVWETVNFDLTPYVGNTQVVLRFHHDDEGTFGYYVSIDDVLVTGTLPGLDLELTGFTQPSSSLLCSTTSDVNIQVENVNATMVNSFEVEWFIDGVSQGTVPYTGAPLMQNGIGFVSLGTGVTLNAGETLTANITQVNGGATQISTTNDNASVGPFSLAIGGTFTIDPAGFGDYATLEDAFTDIKSQGICAPVRLEMVSGTHTGDSYLDGPIAGSSATNTITITSQSGNAADVTAEVSGTNPVLTFTDVSNIIVEDITFSDADFAVGDATLMELNGEVNNFTLQNNIFLGDENLVSTVAADALFDMNNFTVCDGHLIQDNTFRGGSAGVYYSGEQENLEIIGNEFTNNHRWGLRMNGPDNAVIRGNIVTNTTTTATEYQGIYTFNAFGGIVENNYVYTEVRGQGFHLEDLSSSANPGRVVNNTATMGQANSTDASYAFEFSWTDEAEVYHNSGLLVSSTNPAGAAMFFDGNSDNNVFENNVAVNDGTAGTAVRFADATTTTSSDYNVYNAPSTDLAHHDGTNYDLAGLQGANTDDANSVNVAPNFVGVDSLIPTNPAVQLANPIAGITTDLLGDTRDATTPSAGAFEYRLIPGLDLELTSASHPALTTPYCGSSGALTLTITNLLAADITSATISGSYNGGPLSFPDFNYAPASPLTSGNSETITLVPATPGVAPADGDSIELYIMEVNGGATQDDESNDTLRFVVTYGLDGTYTIDPAGTGDFLVLDEAFDKAEAGGMCGPATLNFVDGTHTTNASLDGPIGGLDATNTLTITSQSGDPALTTLQFDPDNVNENFTIRLDEAGHTTISNLTFEETGNDDDFSSQIVLLNAATGNTISNNIFNGDPNATGTTGAQAIMAVAGEQDDLTVSGNTFNDASSGFFAPTGGGDKLNTVIDNNTFNEQHVTGVFYENGSNPQVTNNAVINSTTTYYPFAGFNLGDFNTAGEITNNRVHTDRAAFGMYFNFLSSPTVVSNNVSIVGDVNGGAGNPTRAIDVRWGDGAFFVHNTGVVTAATDAQSTAFNDRTGSFAYEVENNIFVNLSANGFAVIGDDDIINAVGTGSFDYNAYYAPNTDLAEWDLTAQADLAAFQTASGANANAVEADPSFVDLANFDVNVCEPSLQVANPLASVTDDIDGDARDAATPTAGVQELSPQLPTAPFLGADTTVCSGQTVDIGIANTPGLTYNWNAGPTPTQSEQTVSTANTYELTVSGACGTVVDDRVVGIFTDGTAAFTSAQGATKFDYDFTNTSTGDGSDYSWDFGDGNSSTDSDPSHTYAGVGDYTVTLTYTDTCGNVTTATEVISIPCEPLTADFTSAQGATKYDYDFTDASTGDIETWAWDFGDGNSSSLEDPSHTYASIGTYTVELTVTDSCGNTESTTETITIDCDALTADFTSAQGATKYDYDFTDASSGDIETWAWDFGDGNSSALEDPSHTYASIGTYTVELTVTDSCGNTQSTTETITIDCDPLTADIGSAQGATNLDYDFTSNGTGDVETWAWDFGDGNSSSVEDPSHSYAMAGTYTVTLTVTDSCGNTATDNITVTAGIICDPLAASFTSTQGATKYDYDFTNTSTGSIDVSATSTAFDWDFGDGNTSTAQNPTHTYTSIGTYTVTFTVTDSCGNTETATETITIDCDPLTASIGSAQGATNLDYDFTDQSTGDVETWEWDFGDGSPVSNLEDPSHTYALGGAYTVTLTVTDSCGNTATDDILVNAGTTCGPLTASFTTTPGATKFDFSFENTSTGSIDTTGASVAFSWDFGDGNTSSAQDPNHTYSSIGTYTVTFTVTDSCGNTETATETVTVDCDPLDASFTSAQGATALDRDFTDASSGDVETWAWDFGDGNNSSAENPSHTYALAGNYTVTLIVTDSCGNTDTFTEDITVGVICDPLDADFTFNQTAAFNYDFTNTSTGSIDLTAGSTAFEWDFGDGSPTSNAQNPSHIYTSAGTFTVTLTVTDSCGNTDTHTETVTPGTAPCAPIDVDFTIEQGGTPYDFVLEFDGTGDIADFDWDVDGITYTGDSINITFPDTGTFEVELLVTDDCGDQDSITKVITIQLDSRADLIDAGLSIYPNPATDFVTLSFETTISNGTFELYNLNGQLIQRESLTPNTPQQQLSLQDVSEGVYLVRILEGNTQVSQRKLIIRR